MDSGGSARVQNRGNKADAAFRLKFYGVSVGGKPRKVYRVNLGKFPILEILSTDWKFDKCKFQRILILEDTLTFLRKLTDT